MFRPSISVLAKAPIPGMAKTRLIPAIGAHAAAVLQERLTLRTIETALAAELGRVTLWCTPDASHASFLDIAVRHRIELRLQPEDDLGARMLAAMQDGPTLVIGTDCPAFTPAHLNDAARALYGQDIVLVPAEDGGYVLIGSNAPQPGLFEHVAWGTSEVTAQTHARAEALELDLYVLASLWDVDTEDDLTRMEREFPELRL